MGRNRDAKPPRAAPPQPVVRLPRMHPRFREDLAYWFDVDVKLGRRLLRIVEAVLRDPFVGIGKPEALRQEPGTWSRRLTDEHRVTYMVTPEHVDFLQARFHYDRH